MGEFMITVDSREKDNALKVLDAYNIPYKVATLSTGDYQIERGGVKVTVERKTVSDFIGSLMSGRLESQMRRLAAEPLPILVITGSFSEYKAHVADSDFTKDQLIGAISSCIVKYGMRSVIWIQGISDSPHASGLVLITKLLKKISEDKLDRIPDRKLRNRGGDPRRELVHLCCGVPSNVADELLKEFGCPLGVFMATDEQLLRVKGMGLLRIKKMRELIGGLL